MKVKNVTKVLIAFSIISLMILNMSGMYEMNVSTAADNTSTSNTLKLGATLWRENTEKKTNSEASMIAYKSIDTNAEELRVWKLVKQPGDVTTMDSSKAIYCLKAGIGFTGMLDDDTYTEQGVEYNKSYDMYNASAIESALGWDEPTYNKVMWIIENMYVPGVETTTDKENLLKDINYTEDGDTYSLYDWMTTTQSSILDDLTDNDIEAIEQMAIWYFTNSEDPKYHNENVLLSLGFRNSLSDEASEFKTITNWYGDNDYSTQLALARQDYAKALFQYFINGANDAVNNDNYTPSTTSNIKATFWTYEGTGDVRQPVVVIEKPGFDLALRKYITKVNDQDYEALRTPNIDTSKLNTYDEDGNLITTATYNHRKLPIEVETGDTVIYNITVYNEGDIAGRATEIIDQLPDGLVYDRILTNGYNVIESGDKIIITENTSVSHKTLNPFVTGNTTLDSNMIKIQCKVRAEVGEGDKVLTNIAWISEAVGRNANGDDVPMTDRDSQPDTSPNKTQTELPDYKGNTSNKDVTPADDNYFYKGEQDDDDFEKLVLKGGKVDFALRKFITKVGDTEITDRYPQVDTTNLNKTVGGVFQSTAVYNHKKTPLTVKVGDVVTYTIRVYNEGNVDGYISKITDHLPEWLDFIPEDNDYLWTYDDESDLRTISTNITAKDTVSGDTMYSTRINGKLLKAWDGTVNKLDYIDVKVKCRVNSNAEQGVYMTNIAEITGMTDAAGVNLTKDRDSGVTGTDLADIPEDLPNYKQSEINSGRKYIPGQEDDDDFEKVVVATFDLRLRKFITAVDDTQVTDRYPQVSYKTNPTKNTNILEYTHPKKESPVSVVKGNVVTYTLRVYNEGDVAGYAEEITDYLIDNGLKFLPDNSTNQTYGWKMIDENGNITTDVTKAVKVVTDYLSYETEQNRRNNSATGGISNIISPFDKTKAIEDDSIYTDADILFGAEPQNPDYRDIKIAFEVVEANESQRILENAAEISECLDINGNKNDVDSTPDRIHGNDIYENNGNGANDEDDFDKDYVRLTSFDLALRKFITNVDGMPVNNRYPNPTYSDELGRIVYNHPKTPVEVTYGDVVTYTIRVYNEGTQDGYAQEITDDLPEYLTFLPEDQTNIDYRWVLRDKDGNPTDNLADAVCVTTDYLSKERGATLVVTNEDGTTTTVNTNLLEAFNKEAGISDNNPDYCEVQIAFRVDLQVTRDNLEDAKRILINEAQISKHADQDGNSINLVDIDSEPHRDEKYNYEGDNEDDIDYEPVKVKYFDLALKKWVTQSIVTENGKTTVTESGHTGDENPEPPMKVEIKSKSINKVNVKFRFNIKVTNEGEIAGYATEVTDHIPEGLEFVEADNPEWYVKEGNLVATRALENTLLEPGESATVDIILEWINGNNNFGLKTNYAEISEDYNASNTPDIDSTPGNLNGEPVEDDEDLAPVILSIKTGEAPMYFALAGSVIGMFTGGVFAIKKYVI